MTDDEKQTDLVDATRRGSLYEMRMYQDVIDFHAKLGFAPRAQIAAFPDPELLKMRIDFLQEELDETQRAADRGDMEEFLDGLVDLVYVAFGTAHLAGIDIRTWAEAWHEVQYANMKKKRGVTKRGHSFDAVKPEGWKKPDHASVLRRQAIRAERG